MQKAKNETKKRRHGQLVTPASRAKITRMVCAGTCWHCRQFPPECDCGNYQADHSYRGTRRGVRIQIELLEQAAPCAERVRYRAYFPAVYDRGAGRRAPGEQLKGMAGTVFDAIQRIQRKYERRQLRT